jgi:hypothetical protein
MFMEPQLHVMGVATGGRVDNRSSSRGKSQERISTDPDGDRVSADPDAFLARSPEVQYRYKLLLTDPRDAGDIFQFLEELRVSLCYMLVVPSLSRQQYRTYIGLGSTDLQDLPLRMAARGIQIERGEAMSNQV